MPLPLFIKGLYNKALIWNTVVVQKLLRRYTKCTQNNNRVLLAYNSRHSFFPEQRLHKNSKIRLKLTPKAGSIGSLTTRGIHINIQHGTT